MSDNLIWEDRKHFMWFPWSFTKYYIENERLMIEAGRPASAAPPSDRLKSLLRPARAPPAPDNGG